MQITNKHEITLPEFHAAYSSPLPREELLLAGGGRAPSGSWLRQAAMGLSLIHI